MALRNSVGLISNFGPIAPIGDFVNVDYQNAVLHGGKAVATGVTTFRSRSNFWYERGGERNVRHAGVRTNSVPHGAAVVALFLVLTVIITSHITAASELTKE